jgi:hypothetical protein
MGAVSVNKGHAILVLGACFVLILTSFGLGVALTYSRQPQEQRYQSYRYAPEDPVQIEHSATRQTNLKSFEYRTPCDEPKGRDESDLCAQWRAAKAAETSAIWTRWGFWVGVVGSTLLLWQIVLTRQAVEDTNKATRAMERQNELTDAAQRPWLAITVEPLTPFFIDGKIAGVSVDIRIKNTGQKIATDLIMSSCMYTGASRASERDKKIDPLRNKVREMQAVADVNRRLVLPGQSAKGGDHLECSAIANAVYRILVYVEYKIEGEGKFKYAWSSFDVFEHNGKAFHNLSAAVSTPLERVRIEPTGIGGAN